MVVCSFRICGKIWKPSAAMANPNPNPATRFGATGGTGNPSRAKQKGARDRLSAAFLNDFADDYDAHGKTVIETVRRQDPIAYMRIAAALLPNKIEITEERPFPTMKLSVCIVCSIRTQNRSRRPRK